MKTRNLIFIICLLAVAFIVSSCSSAASNPKPISSPASTTAVDGATLVQERCSVCHPLARIESSKHTASDWKTIVDLMISRGAQLTPDEETVVVNYLASKFGQ
jgi:hypothetical protein